MESQGRAFQFPLSVGVNFAFTLDTREEATFSKGVRKNKLSPSTIRGNEMRKKEFLDKKEAADKNPEAADNKSEAADKKPVAVKKSEKAGSKTKKDVSEKKDGSEAEEPAVMQKVRQPSSPPERQSQREIFPACDGCRSSRLPCARHRYIL